MLYYYTKYGNLEGELANKKTHLDSVSLQTSTLPLTLTTCIEQNAILKVCGL